MLDHSGIGTYLSNVLPGVLQRCAALTPLVLTLPDHLARALELTGASAEVLPWPAPPLTFKDLRPPPFATAGDLWWIPHFNVPLFTRLPLVVTLHDVLPLNTTKGRWPLHKRLAVRAWLGAIKRRARRVICDSEFTRQEAIRLARLDARRMSVVPLGVGAGWAAEASAPAPGELPYLIFVGLVKPHKNLLGLLRAFQSIAAAIPHRLIVVGRHTDLREVDDEALRLARTLAPRVQLFEGVSRVRLAALVAGADLLVQPSFHEGFGLPPLEAMAAGTPVLVARAGAMPEVCGDAALYCNPESHEDIGRRILQILGDDRLRSSMRERGLERSRLFTWDKCAESTAGVLLAACSNPMLSERGR